MALRPKAEFSRGMAFAHGFDDRLDHIKGQNDAKRRDEHQNQYAGR